MVIFYLVLTAPAKWRVYLRAKMGHYRNRYCNFLQLQQKPQSSENAEGTANPFVSPIKLTLDPANQAAASSGERSESDASQSESNVTSRMHLSDEQLKVKQNFEAKQREEARVTAMKEKQRRKRVSYNGNFSMHLYQTDWKSERLNTPTSQQNS